jgi:spore coat polysaccharide biosynthesis protein SpsF
MITCIVIQARMSSRRLRGKSLLPLNGRPLLERVVERARLLPFATELVVATSSLPADDPIAELLTELGIRCFRGDEQDVLGRFAGATAHLGDEDTVVRLTADNPFYDGGLAAIVHRRHREGAMDYTSVRGLSHVVPEFIRVGALRVAAASARGADEREHVTPWLRRNAEALRVLFVEPGELGLDPALDGLLTIDSAEDLERVNRLLETLETADGMSLERIYGWLRHEPGAGWHTGH